MNGPVDISLLPTMTHPGFQHFERHQQRRDSSDSFDDFPRRSPGSKSPPSLGADQKHLPLKKRKLSKSTLDLIPDRLPSLDVNNNLMIPDFPVPVVDKEGSEGYFSDSDCSLDGMKTPPAPFQVLSPSTSSNCSWSSSSTPPSSATTSRSSSPLAASTSGTANNIAIPIATQPAAPATLITPANAGNHIALALKPANRSTSTNTGTIPQIVYIITPATLANNNNISTGSCRLQLLQQQQSHSTTNAKYTHNLNTFRYFLSTMSTNKTYNSNRYIFLTIIKTDSDGKNPLLRYTFAVGNNNCNF